MTWKSKIMPDDAPELEGTLVGGILQREQQARRHREAHAAALAMIRHLIKESASRRRVAL